MPKSALVLSPAGLRVVAAALGLALAPGCAYTNKTIDDDRRPTVHTGARATILYPNQTGPTMPTYPGGPAPGAQPGTAAPPPAGAPGGEVTLLGGTDQDIQRHKRIKQEPILVKVLLAPFALIALPFVKIAEALKSDPQPAAPAAPGADPQSYSDLQSARDRAEQQALERELANRGLAPAVARPPAPTRPEAAAPPAPRSPRLSIAEELAALRGTPGPAPTVGRAALPVRPTALPAEPPRGVADQVSDRDHDGRPDQWIYRDAGRPLRELFDENGDGAPDRTVHYVLETGERGRIEEDTDFDGRVDSWTEFRDGRMSRRRSDTDGDGALDTWSFHRDGRLAREEHDGNADGYRDRIDRYRDGRLSQRDEDTDGDGRPDRVTHYDTGEQVLRIDEDRDGDGLVDVRSHYEGGRLTRRELVADERNAAIEPGQLRGTTWDEGEDRL